MLLACRLPGIPQSFGELLTTSKHPAVPAEAPGLFGGTAARRACRPPA
jgi:hypothetical protein